MSKDKQQLDCYIASTINPFVEGGMNQYGIRLGILLFAIPEYGIQFKCRAGGKLEELEIGALLALMRFISTSLKKHNIKSLKVYSSNIQVVSILMNNNYLLISSKKMKKLNAYKNNFDLTVTYISNKRNRAFISPVDYPSVPKKLRATVKLDVDVSNKVRIQPIQTGVDL